MMKSAVKKQRHIYQKYRLGDGFANENLMTFVKGVICTIIPATIQYYIVKFQFADPALIAEGDGKRKSVLGPWGKFSTIR